MKPIFQHSSPDVDPWSLVGMHLLGRCGGDDGAGREDPKMIAAGHPVLRACFRTGVLVVSRRLQGRPGEWLG